MGMIAGLVGTALRGLFGDGRNVVAETAEVFRANAEASAGRAHALDSAALAQLSAEFAPRQRGWFDRLMDGVNRLPRPLMVLGLVWMLVETARNPEAMARVFGAWAVLPEAAWVVFGIVVTFYFGGRAQLKDQEFRRGLAQAAVAAAAGAAASGSGAEEDAAEETGAISALSEVAAEGATLSGSAADDNPALAEWRASGPRAVS
ncbi:3TM-type holin [uncultured Salipiger sp.]|uniref:3TM-type holin n=1 Tax=uncultured Salipiger sp. TaxID=499810 RepID=UPI002592EF1E|nr:3TM-type holin [uncultured Salipiger sp.]